MKARTSPRKYGLFCFCSGGGFLYASRAGQGLGKDSSPGSLALVSPRRSGCSESGTSSLRRPAKVLLLGTQSKRPRHLDALDIRKRTGRWPLLTPHALLQKHECLGQAVARTVDRLRASQV